MRRYFSLIIIVCLTYIHIMCAARILESKLWFYISPANSTLDLQSPLNRTIKYITRYYTELLPFSSYWDLTTYAEKTCTYDSLVASDDNNNNNNVCYVNRTRVYLFTRNSYNVKRGARLLKGCSILTFPRTITNSLHRILINILRSIVICYEILRTLLEQMVVKGPVKSLWDGVLGHILL